MKHNRVALFVLLAFLVGMTACPKAVVTAKQTAVAVHEAWPLVQMAFATAYKNQSITEAQWQQFVEIDKKVIAAQNTLVDALKLYEAAKSAGIENRDDLAKIILLQNELQALYQQAIALAGTFGLSMGGVR